MELEHRLSPLAATHLLQHTLRSLCIHENSQWVYAVFWRILPRNYPPPKWDDRSRGNRRNWILVWEDGFCNFAASAEINSTSSAYIGNSEFHQLGLQPELFFKMSHEIYNYGEGLIGKVAADHSHKWIYNSADTQPRTWEAQFQSGIKTIALLAVREGVVQLGAIHKVVEDFTSAVLLRKKFNYIIESIPGVLLPHPSSLPFDGFGRSDIIWQFRGGVANPAELLYDHLRITPSMSSLEALLSKLPSVVPQSSPSDQFLPLPQRQRPLQLVEKVAKAEIDQDFYGPETSSSISPYRCQNAHSNTTNNEEFN